MNLPRALAPLRHRDFRIYWAGQAVSLTGTWMQGMALSWVLTSMSTNATDLGISALIGSLPILLLSLKGGRALDSDNRAVVFALMTAVTISAYSIADGLGGRHSGSPHAYTALLFLLDGIAMAIYGGIRMGTRLATAMRINWPTMLFGGVLSIASYWIAIWAMTVAPIGLVAALRETSVIFGALFAVLLLKEPIRAARVVAAGLVVAGAIFIRLH